MLFWFYNIFDQPINIGSVFFQIIVTMFAFSFTKAKYFFPIILMKNIFSRKLKKLNCGDCTIFQENQQLYAHACAFLTLRIVFDRLAFELTLSCSLSNILPPCFPCSHGNMLPFSFPGAINCVLRTLGEQYICFFLCPFEGINHISKFISSQLVKAVL